MSWIVYRVEYHEDIGYFVKEVTGVEKIAAGCFRLAGDSSGAITYDHSEGWRTSEEEAICLWRAEAKSAADAYRTLSYALEDMSTGPSPKIITDRIMMPVMK